jgi:hypothetical protein
MTPECQHIKTSGGKCGSPALRGQPYCYFHSRVPADGQKQGPARRPGSLSAALANLEDRSAVLHATTAVAAAVAGHRIDTKRASLIIYALQIALGNVKDASRGVAGGAYATSTPPKY